MAHFFLRSKDLSSLTLINSFSIPSERAESWVLVNCTQGVLYQIIQKVRHTPGCKYYELKGKHLGHLNCITAMNQIFYSSTNIALKGI